MIVDCKNGGGGGGQVRDATTQAEAAAEQGGILCDQSYRASRTTGFACLLLSAHGSGWALIRKGRLESVTLR